MNSKLFRALPGLSAYGPLAKGFSLDERGLHREGYAIEFMPDTSESWVGNFQLGGSLFNAIIEHPNRHHVIVIAGGLGYVIDPVSRGLVTILQPNSLVFCPSLNVIKSLSLLICSLNSSAKMARYGELGVSPGTEFRSYIKQTTASSVNVGTLQVILGTPLPLISHREKLPEAPTNLADRGAHFLLPLYPRQLHESRCNHPAANRP